MPTRKSRGRKSREESTSLSPIRMALIARINARILAHRQIKERRKPFLSDLSLHRFIHCLLVLLEPSAAVPICTSQKISLPHQSFSSKINGVCLDLRSGGGFVANG